MMQHWHAASSVLSSGLARATAPVTAATFLLHVHFLASFQHPFSSVQRFLVWLDGQHLHMRLIAMTALSRMLHSA